MPIHNADIAAIFSEIADLLAELMPLLARTQR
jgi:hypothetical protein